MHLSGIDLNLLRVFDVLMEERSVTRTGVRLGLTQSAVSHALNRLRYHLDDELFQRNAEGMQPTPRALEIGPNLHAALSQVQSALTPADFDPRVSERRFVIVAGGYGAAVLMPKVVAEALSDAPGVMLEVRVLSTDLTEQLDSGRVDFLIGSVDQAPERYARERLIQEELAWVVRAGHPLAESTVTLKDLVSVPHVVVAGRRETADRSPISFRSSWEDLGHFESELARRGLSRQVRIVVPDVMAAMAIVVSSDMAALVPRRLALSSSQGGRFALIEPPYESAPAEFILLYRKDRLAEPSLAWMRNVLSRAAAQI